MQSLALVIMGSPNAIQSFLDELHERHRFIPIGVPFVFNTKSECGFCERTVNISIFFLQSVTDDEIERVLHDAKEVQVGCAPCCA